jgi:hypothetical protein
MAVIDPVNMRVTWAFKARPAGLEPATGCLEGSCSIHLSYGRSAPHCAWPRSRPGHGKVAVYRRARRGCGPVQGYGGLGAPRPNTGTGKPSNDRIANRPIFIYRAVRIPRHPARIVNGDEPPGPAGVGAESGTKAPIQPGYLRRPLRPSRLNAQSVTECSKTTVISTVCYGEHGRIVPPNRSAFITNEAIGA